MAHGLSDAFCRPYLNSELHLHFACEEAAMCFVAAINTGNGNFAYGSRSCKLGSRLNSATQHTNDTGFWRTEVPNSDTSYRPGSYRAEPFPENEPFESCVVCRPDSNDLGVLRSLKCLVYPKACKRPFSQSTSDRKNQIASSWERYMVSRWRYRLTMSASEKGIF